MKFQSLRVVRWYSATLGMATGAVLYAYAGFGPALAGILICFAVCYGSLAAVRHTEEKNNSYHKLSEYLAVTGMVLFLPLILMLDFLIALVVFLGFAQLALNFQTHDYRRFYVGIAVSFMGILVGAAQCKSGFYLCFVLIYTILAGMTLGYAYIAQRQNVESPRWDWTSRTRVALLMIGLAITIYLILPRFPAGGWLSQPGSNHFYHNKSWEEEAKKNTAQKPSDQLEALREEQRNTQNSADLKAFVEKQLDRNSESNAKGSPDDFGYGGFQREFDIDTADTKGQRFSNQIVARMRADHPQYLRVRIFDLFDGLRWRTSSDQFIKLNVGLDGVELVPPEQYTPTQLQSYDLFIEINLGDYIPAAAVPVKLRFPASTIGIDVFGQLYSPAALKKGTAYEVISQYNILHGRLFAELDPRPLPSYTQLPSRMDPRIGELASYVTGGATSQLDRALALEQHLRTRYQYDFESIFTSQGHTPLSEFLFERRKGHCEYFASALAIMLRTQGIPARLVTGFSATNRNPLTGYFDIYALDGHAWVEAFVDGQGWVILEPTAYYDGPLPQEAKLSARQINDYVQRQIRLRKTLGQSEFTLEGLINTVWHLLYVLVSAALAYLKLFILNSWPWITFLLAIIGAGVLGWLNYSEQWRAYRIKRRVATYTADQPSKDVTFYLTAIEELLGRAGFKHPPGDTIEQYLRHLQSIGVKSADEELSAAFNRIYYNAEPGEPQSARNYKQLFQSLYGLGFRALQAMAKRQY